MVTGDQLHSMPTLWRHVSLHAHALAACLLARILGGLTQIGVHP
jgi:hypothetical protein